MVFSNINNTNKRRLNGKDINRHFDTQDEGYIQKALLHALVQLRPYLVISLHEDDEVDEVYAYCSDDIQAQVKDALQDCNVKLAQHAHGDKAEDGVITTGRQPYKGTLENALKKRNISYCTLETPSSQMDISYRADILINVVQKLLNF